MDTAYTAIEVKIVKKLKVLAITRHNDSFGPRILEPLTYTKLSQDTKRCLAEVMEKTFLDQKLYGIDPKKEAEICVEKIIALTGDNPGSFHFTYCPGSTYENIFVLTDAIEIKGKLFMPVEREHKRETNVIVWEGTEVHY